MDLSMDRAPLQDKLSLARSRMVHNIDGGESMLV
jgi:hypothetical protein